MDAAQRIERLEAEVSQLKRRLNRLRKGNPSDYPFTSWECYGAALLGSLSTGPDNARDFPAYADETSERNDLEIVVEMLDAGFPAQQGLDTFVDAVARGVRYGPELFTCTDTGRSILKEFHTRGATAPELYPVFKISAFPQEDTTHEDLRYMFEDEAAGYSVRGLLLDALSEFWTLDVSARADWASLDAMYWEDILDADGLLTRETYETCLHMALKSTSNFLSN